MQTWMAISICITLALNAIAVVIAAFLKGYGTKKGENLATKEDLQDVVRQVREVTRTAEEIKSEISERSWSRQKAWELKKEVIFDAVKGLSRMENSVIQVFAARAAHNASVSPLRIPESSPVYDKIFDELTEVAIQMKTIAMLMDIVCSEKLVKAFRKVDDDLQSVGMETRDTSKSMKALTELHIAIPGLLKLIREELAAG
jgi:hypothetical protein